jgi:hypothetical protein
VVTAWTVVFSVETLFDALATEIVSYRCEQRLRFKRNVTTWCCKAIRDWIETNWTTKFLIQCFEWNAQPNVWVIHNIGIILHCVLTLITLFQLLPFENFFVKVATIFNCRMLHKIRSFSEIPWDRHNVGFNVQQGELHSNLKWSTAISDRNSIGLFI